MRKLMLLCLATLAVSASPRPAAAGGSEYPAGGARGIGRGASNFARADDPMVMLRNPALLSDLWEDMALAGANVLLADSCFTPTGTFGQPFGHRAGEADVDDFGDGSVFVNPPVGATDLNGVPLPRIQDEPLPQVCYGGPVPVIPTVALTMKLTPDLGVGLGFFPPDLASLNQWGDRDGTIETPNGRRPTPTRYFKAHQNTSYFSALGAVGYRLADWLTVGAGFQWALVAYQSTTVSRPNQQLSTRDDVRTQVFGRDLFIPGVVASAQLTLIDNLDIALGFKWSDRVKSAAKLDFTAGAFGAGERFEYLDATGMQQFAGTYVPTTAHNRRGNVSAPPIWAPQLSVGLRYADRLVPRVTGEKWKSAHVAAGRAVQDSMSTERWDIEVDAVYYLNSVTDYRRFVTPGAVLDAVTIDANNVTGITNPAAGACTKRDATTNDCLEYTVPAYLHGKNHLSLRLGGDYNILPGLFSVRAGVSYETDGADPGYLDITNYMLGRTGIHVGATLRVSQKTDISIGYVHFIQKNVRLLPHLAQGALLPTAWTDDPKKYGLITGENDGVANFPISDSSDVGEGPLYANAGEYFYHLDVISIGLAQHF